MKISFFITLVVLITKKVENKQKVVTYRSYVPDLYKLRTRASESGKKVEHKFDLK